MSTTTRTDRTTTPEAHAWGGLDDATARGLLEEALAAATGAGVTFADVRLVEAEEERLYTDLRGELDERREHNAGLGVRVLRDGVVQHGDQVPRERHVIVPDASLVEAHGHVHRSPSSLKRSA